MPYRSAALLLELSKSPRSLHEIFLQAKDRLQDQLLQFLIHLPEIVGLILFLWVCIFAINAVAGHLRKVAESHATTKIARASQIRTLASVFRATSIGIVSFLVLIQILRDVFAFNLTPLLTSAGIAGVAIGLAAQTIVKDVLNGTLLLIEDQYNVGDVVTVASVTGFVEAMTLRKTSIRGFDGTLYIVPNSQITTVANQSRDFSQTTLSISVDFSADPDKVIPLLKKVALEVRNEAAFKDVFLQDPEIQGVDAIKGSEVLYPIVIRTRPRSQFNAIREMQKRIRMALQENNMLPGSPYRVSGGGTAFNAEERKPPAAIDPTSVKPQEVNPLTGEGL
jgi:moderate conductance mechanosensitive channel